MTNWNNSQKREMWNLIAQGVLKFRMREEQRLRAEDEFKAAMADHRIGDWLEDCIIRDPESRESASELYKSYKHYMMYKKEKLPITHTAFGRALKDLGFDRKIIDGRIQRVGLRLKKEGER